MTLAMPTGRSGQATALGLAGLLLGFLWLGVACPLHAWYAERAQLILQHQALARDLERQAAVVPQLLHRAQALGADAVARRVLLAGATDAVAGAALQEELRRLAAAAGTSLMSVDTLNAQSVAPYRRIGVRVTLSLTWPVLMRLLRAIDLVTPRMFVGAIEIRASPFRLENAEQPLDALLTIFALRQVQPSARAGFDQ